MISIALSSSLFTPIHFVFAIVKNNSEVIEPIPNNVIHITDWGEFLGDNKSIKIFDCNSVVHILWYSIIESKYYEFIQPIDELLINDQSQVIIGCSSCARICIWSYDERKSKIVTYKKGAYVDDHITQTINKEKIIVLSDQENYSPHEVSAFLFNELSDKILPKELIEGIMFDNYMKQFTYRYLAIFGKWDDGEGEWKTIDDENKDPEFEYIEEALYDGTHDKLHDGGLMKYHYAGKPKKLCVKWHVGKSEYSAYFWFEDDSIRDLFDRFYGAHPDTKTDFMIRIDAESRKFELSLYRYGLKEPVIIPKEVYQLIVFKNKFEDYRSENYNQDRGAWIW